MGNVLSFEQFRKHTLPSQLEKGVSGIVKQSYSGGTTKADENLEGPKPVEVKGGGVEHTDTIKGDDLSDPKNAQP